MRRISIMALFACILSSGCGPSHGIHDPAAYLEHLERPGRAEWQRPDAVITALEIGGDEIIYDLGAGSGYFTFRLARAVPDGGVIAVEVE